MKISLDDIKILAKGLYGSYPKSVKFVTKKTELTYSSSGSFSPLKTLENPIFVTNVQVSTSISTIDDNIYICFSATDSECEDVVNVGCDYDISVGSIWKYVKASGNASSGAKIILIISGYELNYTE